MSFLRSLVVFALLLAAPHFARPNILLMTADNLGYGDLGCYGNTLIKTPHLDRLAAEGVRLTDFYTAAPSCTPSRAALLTGRYPLRNGLNHQLSAAENLGAGLRLSEKLLPACLRDAGYATACFGKWNLGFAKGYRPTERGFDEFFGHASGNCDYYTHRYNGRNDLFRGTDPTKQEGYSTDLWADAAIEFMSRKRESPFFVYLPFNAPHFPNPRNKRPGELNVWQAPQDAFESYGWSPDEPDPAKRYRAVVTALDSAIGRVLRSLADHDLEDSTLVIWFSDNGAFMLPGRGLDVASNRPLRDGGVTLYEGGIRVPAIVRWPGITEAGTVCREPLVSMDIFAMCLAAAGVPVPDDRTIDGRNPRLSISGKAPSPHRRLFWLWKQGGAGDSVAVRAGRHKLLRPAAGKPFELYDLHADPGERHDLSADEPELVAELKAAIERWQEEGAAN